MLERWNPATLHATPGYHHVTVAQPGLLVALAGQCPLDASGALAGEDLVSQTHQVAANIALALESAGAVPADVVRTVVYVRSDAREDLSTVWSLLTTSPVAAAFTSAATLLGVAQLGFPGQLVEVDVTAVLPAS